VPRPRWLLANLFLLSVGCTVPNPAFQLSSLDDAGASEAGALDSHAPIGGGGGSQSDGPLDQHPADAPAPDVSPGTPDLGAGDATTLSAGDTAPTVVPDAGPVMIPDAGPVIPDARPVTTDARVDLPAPPAEVNPPVPMGTGLRAQYFDGTELEKGDTGKLVLDRTDGPIDFDWGTGRVIPDIDDDWFSVRWTGQVMPLYSESYTFRTVTDDGVRLWVNGTKVIDGWMSSAQSTSRIGTPIPLQAYKRVDIRMEYFEGTLGAAAHLYWSSPSQPSQIVPKACLFVP
jgi:hypothetical protein